MIPLIWPELCFYQGQIGFLRRNKWHYRMPLAKDPHALLLLFLNCLQMLEPRL